MAWAGFETTRGFEEGRDNWPEEELRLELAGGELLKLAGLISVISGMPGIPSAPGISKVGWSCYTIHI